MTYPPSRPRAAGRSLLESPGLAAALAVAVLALAALLIVPGLLGPSGPPPSTAAATGSAGPSLTPTAIASPTFVRPTPSPAPSFTTYTVRGGDTLNSIAVTFRTTARSIAWWNRGAYPSLDPEAQDYEPDRIEVGWVLVLIPGIVVDENNPPTPSPGPTPSGTPPSSALPSGQPSASPQPTTAAAATEVSHGPRAVKNIALTFDMGGRLDPAVDIVQWLIDHDVHATLFPTGKSGSQTAQGLVALQLAATRPDLFDFGNHSWSHPDFRDLTATEMADQVTRTETALVPIVGSTKPWFRPPVGGRNAAVKAGVGAAGWRSLVMWDVDMIDWRPEADGGPTAAEMVAKLLAKAKGGSIVLMHLGGYHTLEALPGLLAATGTLGLQPVTLTEMLGG
jgi:peptidoglycan/xylan/chitin deacetylase (PgdA/CDA1 family)